MTAPLIPSGPEMEAGALRARLAKAERELEFLKAEHDKAWVLLGKENDKKRAASSRASKAEAALREWAEAVRAVDTFIDFGMPADSGDNEWIAPCDPAEMNAAMLRLYGLLKEYDATHPLALGEARGTASGGGGLDRKNCHECGACLPLVSRCPNSWCKHETSAPPACAKCQCGKMTIPNPTSGIMGSDSVVHRHDACVYAGNLASSPLAGEKERK